jgi:hypothetical protein
VALRCACVTATGGVHMHAPGLVQRLPSHVVTQMLTLGRPLTDQPHFLFILRLLLQVSITDLPPDISLPTAEAVLFIGKAVRVLKQPMSAAASHQALHAHAQILGFSQALHRLQQQEEFSSLHFEHCVESMRAKVSLCAHKTAGGWGAVWSVAAYSLGCALLVNSAPPSTRCRCRACCGTWCSIAAT